MAGAKQEIAWHGFRFSLPADWECLGYTLPAARGRFVFHLREGPQGELSWRRVEKGEPDIARMLEDSRSRAPGASPTPPRPEKLCKFVFLADPKARLALAGRWFEERRLFVQWAFPDWAEDSRRRTAQILESYEQGRGEKTLWRLFGVEAELPPEFAPTEAQILPADVALSFDTPKHLRVTLRRWGLASMLLRGRSLTEVYRRTLPALRARCTGAEETTWRDRPGALVSFLREGEVGWERMLGRGWPGRTLLWHDERANRIHAVEISGPRRITRPEPGEVLP